MNLLPFGELPPRKPRRFLPVAVDFGEWTQIEPLFKSLESRPAQCKSANDLEAWLLDWSELSAAMDEEASRRYIAMTCHTDNADAEKAYLHFVENIEPRLKPLQFALEKLYVNHPLRPQLLKSNGSPRNYAVFDRDVAAHVELFREENVPLETEEAKVSQQYQKLAGSLTVTFRDEEKTLVQMGKFLEEPDRPLRQEAWELVSRRRLAERDNFEAQFDSLLELRGQISRNAGFANYQDFAFKRLGRFDYTPADCTKFHDAIEAAFVPAVRQLHKKRRADLKLDRLRPWDTAVDPLNRPPLKPFDTVDSMVERTQRIFSRLDPSLATGFQTMRDLKLLDLDNRKGKAPGGYQSTLNDARLPFIFMNSVGQQRDVETMLHEAGHAFHALATRDEDLYPYRGAPIEFCEVASMSMELLAEDCLDEFYDSADAARARRTHLEGIIGFFPWMASVDAFQHWVYTHPGHTRADRAGAWLKLMERFGGDVDWTGYEDALAHLWHRQLHIFLHPFYYVEYGIAQLGALQIWANAKRDKNAALNDYKSALALGGSRPLPELFQAAGCRFDFSAATIKPLVELVQRQLDEN